MAILGVITDLGLATSQDAANNEGFHLVPVSFGVSDQAGTLDPARTTANAGLFFEAAISSRVIIDQNSIKFVLTIPPNQIPTGTFKIIKEIYLNINDSLSAPFLFAIGQPTDEIRYNADDQVTLELEMSITNLDLTEQFVFEFTQATEISEHNLDPNAHVEYVEAMRKAGIFVTTGAFPVTRRGQHFEDNKGLGIEFDGSKASVIHGGITFTAKFNGTELNGSQLVFDGVLTTDEVRAVFNAANYPNTVEHDGIGDEFLAVATPTLSGGTYVVQENDVVYKDVDGVYKQALADGTIKSRQAGFAYLTDKLVSTGKYHGVDTGFPIGTQLFLSGTTPGAIVNFDTNVNVGLCMGDFLIYVGYAGDVSANVSQDFDAVVTNSTGVGQFLTTQEAIDFVGSDGRILVNKLEDVKAIIDTDSKNLTIEVNGPDKGWRKFDGVGSIFRIDFDLAPTQGTFRIEWDGQETNDMPFNASNTDVQSEFNLLNGHAGFTVTGDFVSGFTFSSNDLDTYSLPSFIFAGLNEIQRFDFSNVPNDGTFQLDHEGNATVNIAYNDNTAQVETALENLASIDSVTVTGDFASQFFQIEFDGGYLSDGVQEQDVLEVIMSDLELTPTATDINGSTILPILASIVQKGKKPASNLFNVSTPIVITTVLLQSGEQPGPDTAMSINSTNIRIGGLGKFENFENAIILETASDNVVIEAYFPNTTNPISTSDKIAGINYSFDDVQGYAKDIFSQLQITQHPSNPKRAIITGADQIMASGVTLTQEISSLIMQFDGAEIDFSTGSIYEADGTTPLGSDFVPPTITPDQWRWFSINVIPQGVNADTSLKGQLLVLPAGTDGASKELAEKPPFGDKPVGAIAIQGALGDKETTQIVTIKDTFGNLVGKALTLYHPAESVAFWFSDPSLDAPSVLATNGVTGVVLDTFGAIGNTDILAARITVSGGPITIDKVHAYLSKIGTPTGNFAVRLLGETASEPDETNVLATAISVIQMSSIGTNFTNPVIADFGTDVVLANGNYYVEVDATNVVSSAGNFLQWNSEVAGANEIFNFDSVNWLTSLGLKRANVDLVHTIKGYPAIASAADREVEILTLVENDFQTVVASKLRDAIEADVRFTASVTTNKVIVTNADLGAVTDADMGDTGFFGAVLLQGTDTDLTGIENVENKNIRQLGTGSGSGGGSGTGSTILNDLKALLGESFFDYLTPYVSSSDQEEGIDTTDGSFSYVTKTFDLDVGETLTTTDQIDDQYRTDLEDIITAQVVLIYHEDGIDSAPTVELSRNNDEFQAVAMELTSPTSDRWVGEHTFSAEAVKQVLHEYALVNADATLVLNTTTQQIITQEFDTAQVDVFEKVSMVVNKLGAPLGGMYFTIYDDLAGEPNNVMQQIFVDVETLSVGDNTVALEIGKIVADITKFHIGFETNGDYKTSYSTGVDEIGLRADSSAPAISDLKINNGTVWASVVGSSAVYLVEGRNLDLRLKITATDDSKVAGWGVYYGLDSELVNRTKNRNVFAFNGVSDNLNEFQLVNFEADAEFLKVHDVYAGQSYMVPAIELQANKIVFPVDHFAGRDEVYLVAVQTGGNGFDNSDTNLQLLTENHLGSQDPSIDKSVSGRGIILAQDVNGIKKEVALDEFGFIMILDV